MTARLCAAALLIAFLCVLLSEYGWRGKKLFAVLCMTVIFCFACDGLSESVGGILSFAESAGISDAAKCALKVVGAGYVFGFTSDVCKELGEGGVASTVNVVGRIEIFLIVLPYFKEVVKLGVGMLE